LAFVYASCLMIQSCSDRLVRKSIEAERGRIVWYYYSNIGNISTERITIEREGGDEIMLCESVDLATDVRVRSDTIFIKVYPPRMAGLLYKVDSLVLGYKVALDSAVTREDYRHRPAAVRE
jgi:hypothetical protein